MNTLTTIVVLALLVLAGGCVAPSHLTAIPTCDWGQGTTCQDNLAKQMFDARGLRQVLNTTDYIDGLGMDSHLVVWRSGQDNLTLHALDIDGGANWTMADLPNSSFPCVHDGKMLIVHRAMANGANDSEATPWLWLPNQGVQRQVSMLAGRFGTPPKSAHLSCHRIPLSSLGGGQHSNRRQGLRAFQVPTMPKALQHLFHRCRGPIVAHGTVDLRMTRFLTAPDAVGATVEMRRCDGCTRIYGFIETPIGPRPLPDPKAIALLNDTQAREQAHAGLPLGVS